MLAAVDSTPSTRAVAAAFALIAALVVIDIALDLQEGATLLHVSGETLIVLIACAGLATMVRRWRHEHASLAAEVRELTVRGERLRSEAKRWEQEASTAVRAFADAVDQEFQRWNLTMSEREIALLLLKGMSMKEIAAARGTSERTVRQQAGTLYAKAKVEGRAELASYFLDSLSPSSRVGEPGATPISSG